VRLRFRFRNTQAITPKAHSREGMNGMQAQEMVVVGSNPTPGPTILCRGSSGVERPDQGEGLQDPRNADVKLRTYLIFIIK